MPDDDSDDDEGDDNSLGDNKYNGWFDGNDVVLRYFIITVLYV